ncbi:DUF4189 domain-containing protein [Luteimonas deserti]
MLGGLSFSAFAQQPGSNQYNTVFLPAHSAGDTIRENLESRWGAYALSSPDPSTGISVTGFVAARASLEEAKNAAITHCTERGGTDCAVPEGYVFRDTCAVATTGPGRGNFVQDSNLRRARRYGLRSCGKGCRVLWEACSLPSRGD